MQKPNWIKTDNGYINGFFITALYIDSNGLFARCDGRDYFITEDDVYNALSEVKQLIDTTMPGQ